MEVETFGDDGQFGHVLLVAARVGGDEVGDDLLVKILLAVDAVELALEVVELLERRFAHEVEHAVAGVLRCHLQSSAHMTGDEFPRVFLGRTVGFFVLAAIQEQIVTHTAAYEAALDIWQGIYGVVDVEQSLMISVEVRTDLRMDTTGPFTFLTGIEVAAVHAVHIGRGAAEVGEVAFEVGHLCHLFYLFQYALFRAAGDELALMGRDGAESAAAEASAMDVHTVLDHVVGRNALALVFRMRLTGVGQVEGRVKFFSGHRRIWRINDHIAIANGLEQAFGMHHVRLLLYMPEVLGLGAFVAQTLLMVVKHNVFVGGLDACGEIDGLREVSDVADGLSLAESASEFDRRFLAHAIGNHVGT